jgi:hypothetical protein
MNRKTLLLATALLLAVVGAPAQGKKVYRCEIAGKVTYADAPCKDAAEVQADDSRSDAQRKAAQDTVQREQKLADKMQRDRLAAEQRAARQGAAHIPYTAADRAASAPHAKEADKNKKKKPAKKKEPPPTGG